MALTYEPISSTTLTSAVSSVTFSSISGTYTDLVLVITGKIDSGTEACALQFNNDTTNSYSWTRIYGNGTSTVSDSDSNSSNANIGVFNNTTIAMNITHIQNYSNSTTAKSLISRVSSTANSTNAQVNLWNTTNAITSIKVFPLSSNLSIGSTFTLYGIKSA